MVLMLQSASIMDNDVDGKLLAKFDADDVSELAPQWTRIQKKKVLSAVEFLTGSMANRHSTTTEDSL